MYCLQKGVDQSGQLVSTQLYSTISVYHIVSSCGLRGRTSGSMTAQKSLGSWRTSSDLGHSKLGSRDNDKVVNTFCSSTAASKFLRIAEISDCHSFCSVAQIAHYGMAYL